MFDSFKRKLRGQKLTARHVNQLGGTAREYAAGRTTGVRRIGGHLSVPNPFLQRVVQVYGTPSAGAEVCDIKLCYYDTNQGDWIEDPDSGTYDLDLNLFTVLPANDDQLVAYWDAARDAFVPVVGDSNQTVSNTVTNILNSFSSFESWKKTNIDTTLEEYGLTTCYGPFDLTSFSDDFSVGSEAWTTPANAAAEDGDWAEIIDPPAGGATTHYLKALQLVGYAPDAGFVPKVVHVTVKRRDEEGTNEVQDFAVRLVVDGAIQDTNDASAVKWPADAATMSYHFTTAATRAQTLAAGFGVVIAAQIEGGDAGEDGGGGGTTELINDDVLATGDYDSTVVRDDAGSSTVVESASVDDLQLVTTNNGTFGDFKSTFSAARYTPGGGFTPFGDSADIRITATFGINALTSTSAGSVIPTLYLFQDGNVYTSFATAIAVGSGWNDLTFTDLAASSFSKMSGSGPATPNLGIGGADVFFGFGSGAGVNSLWQWTAVFRDFVVSVSNEPEVEAAVAVPQIDHIQIRICGVIP